MKHGLSLPVLQDPVLAPDVARLAAEIAGGRSELLELAISIAEAQLLLLRVRRVRTDLINLALNDPLFTYRANSVRYARFWVLACAPRKPAGSVPHLSGRPPSFPNVRLRTPSSDTPALSRISRRARKARPL